jgi:hypothetical protein
VSEYRPIVSVRSRPTKARIGVQVKRERLMREVGYRARGGACRLREKGLPPLVRVGCGLTASNEDIDCILRLGCLH